MTQPLSKEEAEQAQRGAAALWAELQGKDAPFIQIQKLEQKIKIMYDYLADVVGIRGRERKAELIRIVDEACEIKYQERQKKELEERMQQKVKEMKEPFRIFQEEKERETQLEKEREQKEEKAKQIREEWFRNNPSKPKEINLKESDYGYYERETNG